MKLNNLCIKAIAQRVAQELSPLGFRSEGPGVFRKDVGDVRWYIAFYTHPNSAPGIAEVFATAAVFSEPLEQKVPKLPGPWTWMASQVRATFQRIADLPPDPFKTSTWQCSSEADAQQAAEEMIKLMHSHVLPFLERIRSTDQMIPLMLQGGYSISSKRRAEYDAGVWQGSIDPAVTPWDPGPPRSGQSRSLDELAEKMKRRVAERRGDA